MSVLENTISEIICSGAENHHSGKVRESFTFANGKRAIVVSDRISSFDFILGTVPYKGQVLNQIAAWWFRQLDGVVPHHLIDTPDPNISVVKNAQVLPIEIIVRGYLTGSTKTSSWYAYNNLDRVICGLEMPEGMVKNQAFGAPMITPTTKPETGHDEPVTRDEIFERGLVPEDIYTQAEAYALKMFALGQKKAAERGLILVDTKYEMGLDAEGNLMVIDEVHTPDSSRYWVADSYEARMAAGQEPEMLDKEFVRRMIVEAGYDVENDDQDPADFMTDAIRLEASKKYIQLYEKITGESFAYPAEGSARERIEQALASINS